MKKLLLAISLLLISLSAFARVDVGLYGGYGVAAPDGKAEATYTLIPPTFKAETSPAYDFGIYAEPYILDFLSVNAGVRYLSASPSVALDDEKTTFKYSFVMIPVSVRAYFELLSIPWVVGLGYDVALSQSKEIKRENYDATPYNPFDGEQKDYKGGMFFELGAKFKSGGFHYGLMMKINGWDVYEKGATKLTTAAAVFQLFAGLSF